MIEIRHKDTGQVLLCAEADSLQSVGRRLLSQADLRGANLRGMDLVNLYFGYDLTGAELTRANFMGSVLTRANLAGADLMGALSATLVSIESLCRRRTADHGTNVWAGFLRLNKRKSLPRT